MRVQGRVEEIVFDGYERLISIASDSGSMRITLFQTDEYLNSGEVSRYLAVGDDLSLEVKLCMASKFQSSDREMGFGVHQDSQNSPHSIVVGRVVSLSGADVCVLDIGGNQTIEVELEDEFDIRLGSILWVQGELQSFA